jgi:acetyl esterase/lipase
MRPLFERVARRGLYRNGTARQLLAILATSDRRPMLQKITAPTLVLHGADDPLVPLAAGQDTAANIAGAKLEVVEGMGHDFPPTLLAKLALRIAEHCRTAQPVAPVTPVAPVAPVAQPALVVAAPAATIETTSAEPAPASSPGPTA